MCATGVTQEVELGAFFSTPTPTPAVLIKKTSLLINRHTQAQGIDLENVAPPYADPIM